MSDAGLIDTAALDDLTDHIGADAVRSIVGIFLTETRELVATIMSAATPDVARRAAHSLKSSAGQLGAASLSEAALAVEAAATSGASDLPTRIAALDDCARRTEAVLAARLAG